MSYKSERIQDLAGLDDNWMDGAEKMSTEILTLVDSVLEGLGTPYAPYIYPTPDGGIQLEWDIFEWTVEVEFTKESPTGLLFAFSKTNLQDVELTLSGCAKKIASEIIKVIQGIK